jgi:hypothetical protein
MAVQRWEYCKLTIDHLEGENPQRVTFYQYSTAGEIPKMVVPTEFGQFLAQLGLDSWELAGVSSDQPSPPGVLYRESWVFKRPL